MQCVWSISRLTRSSIIVPFIYFINNLSSDVRASIMSIDHCFIWLKWQGLNKLVDKIYKDNWIFLFFFSRQRKVWKKEKKKRGLIRDLVLWQNELEWDNCCKEEKNNKVSGSGRVGKKKVWGNTLLIIQRGGANRRKVRSFWYLIDRTFIKI